METNRERTSNSGWYQNNFLQDQDLMIFFGYGIGYCLMATLAVFLGYSQKEDLRCKNRESKKLARQKKKSSDLSSNKKSESSKAKIIQPYLCKDGKPYSFQRSPINFSMADLEVSDEDDDNTSYEEVPIKSPVISRRLLSRKCKIQN